MTAVAIHTSLSSRPTQSSLGRHSQKLSRFNTKCLRKAA
jgi:hypothetical protein